MARIFSIISMVGVIVFGIVNSAASEIYEVKIKASNFDPAILLSFATCTALRNNISPPLEYQNEVVQTDTDSSPYSPSYGEEFSRMMPKPQSDAKPIALFFIGKPPHFEEGAWSATLTFEQSFDLPSDYKVEVSAPRIRNSEFPHQYKIYTVAVSQLNNVSNLDVDQFWEIALVVDFEPHGNCVTDGSATEILADDRAAESIETMADTSVGTGEGGESVEASPLELRPELRSTKFELMAVMIPADIIRKFQTGRLSIDVVGYFPNENNISTHYGKAVMDDVSRQLFAKIQSGEIDVPHVMLHLNLTPQPEPVLSNDELELVVNFTADGELPLSARLHATRYLDATKKQYGLLFGTKSGDWSDEQHVVSPQELETARVATAPEAEISMAAQKPKSAPDAVADLGTQQATLMLSSLLFGVPEDQLANGHLGRCKFTLELPETDGYKFMPQEFVRESGQSRVQLFGKNAEYFRRVLVSENSTLLKGAARTGALIDALEEATIRISDRGSQNSCEFVDIALAPTSNSITVSDSDVIEIGVLMPPLLPTFSLLVEMPEATDDRPQREAEDALMSIWYVVDNAYRAAIAKKSPSAAAAIFGIASPSISDDGDVFYHSVPFEDFEQPQGNHDNVLNRDSLVPFSLSKITKARAALRAKGADLKVGPDTLGFATDRLRGGATSMQGVAPDAIADRVIFAGFAARASLACGSSVSRLIDSNMEAHGRPVQMQRIIAVTTERQAEYGRVEIEGERGSPVSTCGSNTANHAPTILISLPDRQNGNIEWSSVESAIEIYLMGLD